MTTDSNLKGGCSDVLKQDNVYYLDATPVVFQVENVLFKVPRYQFTRYSDVFQTMFSLPQKDSEPEGSSDRVPVKLGRVNSLDFQRLLTVLYQLPVEMRPPPTKSQEEWISVLNLATMWNMNPIRGLAINELSAISIDPVPRIMLGKTYNVPAWLKLGYVQLVARVTPISFEEGEAIGWETAIQLCHLREKAKEINARNYYTTNTCNYHDMVENAFIEELREVTMVYETYRHSDLNPTLLAPTVT